MPGRLGSAHGNVHGNWTFAPTFDERGLINDLFVFLLGCAANIFA